MHAFLGSCGTPTVGGGRTHLSALLRTEREIAAGAVASVVFVDVVVAGKTDRMRSMFGARHRRLFTEDYVAGFQVTRCDQVPVPLTTTSFVIG